MTAVLLLAPAFAAAVVIALATANQRLAGIRTEFEHDTAEEAS